MGAAYQPLGLSHTLRIGDLQVDVFSLVAHAFPNFLFINLSFSQRSWRSDPSNSIFTSTPLSEEIS